MKAFVICDYEGTTGTVSWEEEEKLGPMAMAGDVNATIAGLRDGGFTEFVVRDFHSNGVLLNPADVDSAATLIRGKSLPFPYGLESGFSAMVLVGAHARAGAPGGVMSHTMNSRTIYEVRLNGMEIGEIGMFALLASYYEIPLIFLSGDEAACQEAHELLGDVETAAVKTALSSSCARCLHPSAARELIRKRASVAARRLGEFRPFKMDGPFSVDIAFHYSDLADRVAIATGAQKTGNRSIRVECPTLPELFRCFDQCFLIT